MRARTALVAALAQRSCWPAAAPRSGTDAAVEGGAPAVAGDMMVTEEMPAAEGMPADGKAATTPTVTTDRQIIKTGYVSMQVDDVTTSAFDVHALIKKRNGLISSEDTQSSGDMTYSNITAQIPAADLDAFIADVSALGTVTSINVNAQDVTTQVVDLDARIKALQTSIDRLTQLLAEASRIEDLLAIETQLSQRQAELDALTAQRTWLGDQVAMSTITVSLSPVTQIADVDAPGLPVRAAERLGGLPLAHHGRRHGRRLLPAVPARPGAHRDPGDHRHRPSGPPSPSADPAGAPRPRAPSGSRRRDRAPPRRVNECGEQRGGPSPRCSSSLRAGRGSASPPRLPPRPRPPRTCGSRAHRSSADDPTPVVARRDAPPARAAARTGRRAGPRLRRQQGLRRRRRPPSSPTEGFVVLAYSARGFGASTGLISMNSPEFEVADASRPRRLPRRPAGGREPTPPATRAWASRAARTAARWPSSRPGYDDRVDAVAADITWNDLQGSLFGQSVLPSECRRRLQRRASRSRASTSSSGPGSSSAPGSPRSTAR